MLIRVSLTLIFAGICLSPSFAQESEASSQCDRSWLASDWPTVAVQCDSAAAQGEAIVEHYKTDAPNEPTDMQSTQADISAAQLLFSGLYRARAAVAYARLKRPSLYKSMLAKARSEIAAQQPYLEKHNAALYSKSVSALTLLDSKSFVRDAVDAEVLSHI